MVSSVAPRSGRVGFFFPLAQCSKRGLPPPLLAEAGSYRRSFSAGPLPERFLFLFFSFLPRCRAGFLPPLSVFDRTTASLVASPLSDSLDEISSFFPPPVIDIIVCLRTAPICEFLIRQDPHPLNVREFFFLCPRPLNVSHELAEYEPAPLFFSKRWRLFIFSFPSS